MIVDDGRVIADDTSSRLTDLGLEVRTADLHRPSLDDVFLGLTGRSLREHNTAGTDLQDDAADSPTPAPHAIGEST